MTSEEVIQHPFAMQQTLITWRIQLFSHAYCQKTAAQVGACDQTNVYLTQNLEMSHKNHQCQEVQNLGLTSWESS